MQGNSKISKKILLEFQQTHGQSQGLFGFTHAFPDLLLGGYKHFSPYEMEK
jgi:hypothetical protein